MKQTRDPISIIEAAYAVQQAPTTWLEDLAGTFSKAFGTSQGGLAFLYDASSKDWVHINGVGHHCLPSQFSQTMFDQPDLGPDKAIELARLCATVRVGTTSTTLASVSPLFQQLLDRYGMEDMLIVNALDPTLRGCIVMAADRARVYSPRMIAACRRISVHISAGNRLRRALAVLEAQGREPAQEAEAVLTPGGRVEHAVGPAKKNEGREALRNALVRIDAARSRRASPEHGVKLWSGLVSGRWSLIEHFERDGRRYYLAHQNDPQVPRTGGLTRRERQVLAYAELGSSNKLIAYSLGISLSTVSTLLARARRKLGARSL